MGVTVSVTIPTEISDAATAISADESLTTAQVYLAYPTVAQLMARYNLLIGGGLYTNQPEGTVFADHFYDGLSGGEPIVYAKVGGEDAYYGFTDDVGRNWGVAMNRNREATLTTGHVDPTSPTTRRIGRVLFANGLADGEDVLIVSPGNLGSGARDAWFGNIIRLQEDWIYHGLGVKALINNFARTGGGSYTFLSGGLTDGGYAEMSTWNAPKLSSSCHGFALVDRGANPPLIAGGAGGDNQGIFPYNVSTPPLKPRGSWIKWEVRITLGTVGQSNGRFRLWIDGQLVTDYNGIRWPDDIANLGIYTIAFTWGGGGSALTQNQFFDFANTRIVLAA